MFASEELRADKEIILKVIEEDPSMFEYVADKIMSDKDFVLQVIDKNPICIKYVSSSLLSDEEKIKILKNNSLFMNSLYLLPKDIDEYINDEEFDMSKLVAVDNIGNRYYIEFLKKMSKKDIENFNIVLDDCSSSSLEKYKIIKKNIKINKIFTSGSGCTVQEFEQVLKKINKIKELVDVPSDEEKQRDYEIFSQVYVMLANNIVYDYDAISPENKDNCYIKNECRSLYGGLVKGKSVCAGYANILKQVLSQYNIRCNCIKSKTEEGVSHSYNQVFIDGKWYNCDLTWDTRNIIKNHTSVRNSLKSDKEFGVNVDVYHTPYKEAHICAYNYKHESDKTIDIVEKESEILNNREILEALKIENAGLQKLSEELESKNQIEIKKNKER